MTKVKIYGAGSIGNHLAHASRNLGYDVVICDLDRAALERTKNEIYPQRYGKWDNAIQLAHLSEVPQEKYDVIIIGTPPDSHLSIAEKAIKDEPKIILIEKPICAPDLKNAQTIYEKAKERGVNLLVGYNHVLGTNTVEAEKLLEQRILGNPITLEAGFKEYWGGIFKAHPWLKGPQDTYLGFSERGGGASGEHSHAINIWQHFANKLNLGKIIEVSAIMDTVENMNVEYDRICNMNVRTDKGVHGNIVQDVVTEPSKKYVRIQGDEGFLEWRVNYDKDGDAIKYQKKGGNVELMHLPKKRTDDFRLEMEHVDKILKREIPAEDSPIAIERGLDTMLVIRAAHLSNKYGKSVFIDYDKGYTPEAIDIQ